MSAVRPRLSIDVGTSCTSAALDRGDGNPVVVPLGTGGASAPSTVALADGQVAIGDAADAIVAMHPERGVRELKRRFGDTTPVVLDGQPYTADALTAEVLRSVAGTAGVDPGDATVVLTHPAGWHEYKRDLLAATGARAGFADVEVVSEAEAAVRPYANSGRLQRGSTVAVYDLGGTFEVSLVALTDEGLRPLGTPQALERLGGDVLDQVVFRHVDEALGGTLQQLDRNDPAVRAAIATLRTECTAAKERLSSDGETSIPVVAPGLDTRVRVTRDEFETAVRPLVNETLMAVDRLLASAGLQAADLTAVVLVGGGSQVPVVAEMVAGHLGRPALVDDPRTAVVLGAVASGAVVSGAAVSGAAAAPTSAAVDAAAFPTPTTSSTTSEPRENPMSDQPAPENAAPAAGASTGAPAGGAGGRVIPTPPPAPGKKVSSRTASIAGGLAAAAAAITAAVFYGDDVVDAFDGPDGDANAAGIADAAAAETRTADRAERDAAPDDSMDAFDDASADALTAQPVAEAQGAAVGTPLAPPAPQQEAFDRPAPQRSQSQQQQQRQSFDDDGPEPASPRQAPAAAAMASGAAAAATAGAADAAAAAAPAVDAQFEASRAQLLARLDRFEAPEGTSPEDAQALKDELRETIENFDPRPGQTAEDALVDLRAEFDDTVQDFTQDQRIDALIDEVERDRAEDAAEDAAAPDPVMPPVVDPAAEADDGAAVEGAAVEGAAAGDAAEATPDEVEPGPVGDADSDGVPDEVVPGPAGDADDEGIPDHVGPARDLGDVIAPPTIDLDPNLLEEPPRFDPSVLEDGTLPTLDVDLNPVDAGDGVPAPDDAGGRGPAFADAQLADTQLTDRLPDRAALLDDGFDQLTTIDVGDGLPVAEDPDAGGEITRPGFVGDEAVPQVRATVPEGVDRPTMMADLGDDTYEGVKEAAEADPAGILIGMDTAPTMQDAVAATPIVDLGAPVLETELLPAVDVAEPIVLDLGEPIVLDLETEDVDLAEAPGLAEELHNDITPQAPDNLDFGG